MSKKLSIAEINRIKSINQKFANLTNDQIEYLQTEMENEIRINANHFEKLTNAFNELIKEGIHTDKERFNQVIKLINFLLKDIRDTKRWFLFHLNNPEQI